MKTCKWCNKEFDEKLTFCPFCGKENADKKLSYIEKKQAKDKDTQVMLSKASIQDEDIKDVSFVDPSNVTTQKHKSIKELKILNIISIVISVLVIAACITLAEIYLKGSVASNVKLLIVTVAYFIVAIMATLLMSEIGAFISFRAISKTQFLIMKVYFGKGPMFTYNGFVYELATNKSCEVCEGVMHVEAKDDEIFLVCSKDRSHILKVDKEKFIEAFKVEIEKEQ